MDGRTLAVPSALSNAGDVSAAGASSSGACRCASASSTRALRPAKALTTLSHGFYQKPFLIRLYNGSLLRAESAEEVGWPPQLGVAPEGQVAWHGELPYHHNPLERNS
jgi:hypothetical protein